MTISTTKREKYKTTGNEQPPSFRVGSWCVSGQGPGRFQDNYHSFYHARPAKGTFTGLGPSRKTSETNLIPWYFVLAVGVQSHSPEYLLIFRSSTDKRPVYLLERLLESKLRVVDEPRVSCESCW